MGREEPLVKFKKSESRGECHLVDIVRGVNKCWPDIRLEVQCNFEKTSRGNVEGEETMAVILCRRVIKEGR